VLKEIDVKATVKKRLDADFDNYPILGHANPPYTHRTLVAEKDIGLMFPCNVVVQGQNSQTFVSAIMPTMAMVGN